MSSIPASQGFRERVVDGGRQALRASIFFLILFLFVRTVALEPFGVPTGSMAVSLLGNHREVDCPRCGIAIVVGEPNGRGTSINDVTCPNCGLKHVNFTGARELPGDRLLVDKNVYNLRLPRRWEVAVFRCPVDDSKPYVKRVVGLPGELIHLDGGDAYADGVLLRKTADQCRECRVPVFDLNHAPPGGWGSRFVVDTVDGQPAAKIDDILRGGVLHLDGTCGLSYRNLNVDRNQEEPLSDALAYNGNPKPRREQTVHDFFTTFDLEAGNAGQFACRLFDGLDSVYLHCQFGIDGFVSLGRDGDAEELRTGFRMIGGKSYRVEFGLVDRRAWLAIDGTLIPPALDLPAESLLDRKGVSRPVQFGVRGGSAIVRNFQLWRDVHLRSEGPNCRCQLGTTDYYMLGDNSASSHDSREWAIPGVPEGAFLGKPFLIHQPLRLGRVTVGGQDRTYQAIDWSRLRWVR